MGTAWFVDGSYAYECWRATAPYGHKLDFCKFRQALEVNAGEKIGDAYYFNAESDPPSAAQSSFHRAIAGPPPRGAGLRVKLYWLSHKPLYWPRGMGGEPVLHPDTGVQYELTTQKGVDVGLAFHLMRSFSKTKWDRLYLTAGDGDFHEVVQHLVENENVFVTLVGDRGSISPELAPYASNILYLEDLVAQITLQEHR